MRPLLDPKLYPSRNKNDHMINERERIIDYFRSSHCQREKWEVKSQNTNRTEGSTENHRFGQESKEEKIYERTGEITRKGTT